MSNVTPFQILRSEMKPHGARLEAGVVTAVDVPTKRVSVSLGGTVTPDIPVVGGAMPVVDDRIWLIRQGATIIALGNAT